MSSISVADAAVFSTPRIPERYYLEQRPTSQLFNLIPFVPIDGDRLVLSSVRAADGSEYFLSADAEAAAGALAANTPQVFPVSFPVKRLVAELEVDGIVEGVYGSGNDIVHELIRLKVDAVRDHFKALLYRGDASAAPEEFDGLARLALPEGPFAPLSPAPQTIVANGAGGTVQPGEISALLGLLSPRTDPDSTYLVMHAKTFQHLRRNDAFDLEYVVDPHLGPTPCVDGVPILIDNFIPVNETFNELTSLTSVYAVILGEDQGLCGIYPSANEGDPIQVRGPYVKEVKDRTWYHVAWDVGLACFNSGAVARLRGIQHAN